MKTNYPALLVWVTFAATLLPAIPSVHALVAGSVDSTFNPNLVGAVVMTTAVQPDGKVVVGGFFDSVGGQPRNGLARLHVDGTVESTDTFNPGSGANSTVYCAAVQADGKILIGGLFTAVNDQIRNYVARLHADGTLEDTATFNPGTGVNGIVYSVVVQVDGKILLGGSFTAVNGQTRHNLARLNADGTLESTATFNPGTGPNGPVYSVAVQSDGKIVVGGNFAFVNQQARRDIARLHANGTLESTATFNPGTGSNAFVYSVAMQADGRILLGGDFTTVNDEPRNSIARLNTDGTLESIATFDPGTGASGIVFSVAVQVDGKILLGGSFATVNDLTRRRIARLNPNGTVEDTATFDSGTGTSVTIHSVVVQADGKILISGPFSVVNGQSRNRIARLANDVATQFLTITNNDRVQWFRGGAAPEVEQVTFELSTNGGAIWNSLGAGTRIAGGWERYGLSLPASGSIRARGRSTGSRHGGSSGLVETVAGFGPDADGDGLRDAWELAYWPTTAGHNASDDSDHDGFTELQELAFGLNPTLPDSALQPAVIPEGGYLTITLTKHSGAAYEVQSAGTLLSGQPASFSPDTTTVLLDNGTTLKVRDSVSYGTPPGRFLRVKVTAAP